MREFHYPELGERCFSATLPNGLALRVIPKTEFSRTYAFIAFGYGAIDTSFTFGGKTVKTPDGIAHYLEHKMFDMPYGDAMNRFAEFGGNPNAFTSYDMTAYYVECTEQTEENIRTLLEFVTTPYFTQKSVDKERGIIAQEIRMYEDNPDSRVYDDLFKLLYRHHPVRVPIAGTVESIAEITPELLELCHRAFYAPKNAVFCVVGDVEPEKVFEIAQSVLPDGDSEIGTADHGAAEVLTVEKNRSSRKMEVAMPSFVVGFKSEPPARGVETMRREFLGDLAADLLLGTSSELYLKLYESGLIDSGFSAGYEGIRGVSMFSFGGDSRDPEAVLETVLRGTEKVLAEGFDEGYFSRILKATHGRKLHDLDSFENLCFHVCSCYLDGADYFSFRDCLNSIRQEDVLNYLRTNLRGENCAMSVIRPVRE